ncbi:MAG: AAA family ATPase, partial [Pseudomonadales bacterium]
LEDGRLTDGHGRTVDFRNTVVVMTSNLGSDVIQELAQDKSYDTINLDGKTDDAVVDENRYAAMKEAVMNVVNQHFRPEFINRIDETVVFHPLARAQIRGIATIQLSFLQQRLAERELQLNVSDDVLDKIIEAGFDPVYGARPLKRAIQQMLENPLAQEILAGKFAPGAVIKAELDGDRVSFMVQ